MNTVYVESLPNLPFCRSEIARYCGAKRADEQLNVLIDECLKLIDGKIKNRLCYRIFPIKILQDGINLGFAKINSQLLKKHLKDCDKIVLFSATVGVEIDRYILKYSRISPAKAVVLQAIGAERIEAFCNEFENKLKSRYKTVKPRVSAGYGDIPLTLQKDIFTALECHKNIGLSLNDSLLMSPTKSVTAIIGIGELNEH